MRDPDLVFKAQLAASSLERAWQRWRVVHGLAADPMPAVSSYVGYSLEEPWGQPRVVFGLAADEAEQLVALLDRHDCIGPVHAMVAASGGRGPVAAARGRSDLPLPVPPQAPSVIAEQVASDGPVFRQVAVAAQEAAAVREAVAVRDAAAVREAAVRDAVEASWPGASIHDELGIQASEARTGHEYLAESSASPVDAAEDADQDDAADIEGAAAAIDDSCDSADLGPEDAAAAPHEIDGGERSEHAAGPAADRLGPLALAASAARVVAEARIKAALLDGRSAAECESRSAAGPDGRSAAGLAGLERPYSGGCFDVTDPLQPASREFAGPDGTIDSYCAAAPHDLTPGSMPRPEVASGALYWQGDWQAEGSPEARDRGEYADVAEAWDARSADPADVEAVVPFRPRPDLAAYLDAGPETDEPFDERQDHSGASYTRRNRITRGYSIPRLSRTKRSGAVPGA